jgi:hypothetical protein
MPDNGSVRYRVQYALAPRTVVNGDAASFVVETGAPTAPESLAHHAEFVEVATPDSEIRLYRRVLP